MQKIKTTKKKFYDKWCYKITLTVFGCNMLRKFGLVDLSSNRDLKAFRRTSADKESLILLSDILSSKDHAYQTRIERDNIDVYVNDHELYKQICDTFPLKIKHRFEPCSDIPLLNGNRIATKVLPHGRYKFKVFLQPHKIKGDQVEKQKYLDWIHGQNDRILISDSVKLWFMFTDWNWDRRYIWVEDEATLLMLKLKNADVCGRVYHYELADK